MTTGMTTGQIIVAIVVAVLGLIGTSIGSVLAYIQFVVKRKDEKEEKTVQSQIDATIATVRESISKEIKEEVHKGIIECGVIGDKAIRQAQDEFVGKLEEGLKARGAEGKERFDINSRQIQENSKQLSQNSKQIEELVGIVKEQSEQNNSKFNALAESLTSLNKMICISVESQCNSNYDRLLMVTSKVLKSKILTITDKTNLKQLYSSWKELGGKDAKMDTMYEECMGMKPTLEEEGA